MPTKRPEFLPSAYYHIYNRGAHQQTLFNDKENYRFVIRKLAQYCQQLDHTVIAYCLMPNHYHLLIRQDGDFQASLLPQRVFNSYTKAYNKRFNHSGTLFEDSFHIKIVQDTSHLLHLCRYIHENPVKDGFVSDPADWEYSNYREFIGTRNDSLFDAKFFSDYFANQADYYNFVKDDLLTRNLSGTLRNYLDYLEKEE